RGYKGLTTCVERITHWVIRPTRRLFANALSALTKSEYCAIFAQYSGYTFTLPNSVLLMWDHHFYFIALLIFSFSIVFPFLKLAALFYNMDWQIEARIQLSDRTLAACCFNI
ncbi:MAG: paraquat-inducible protein A, partial [Verrucomicrobia bacterium]|nr:paraquat-inducible protein A [Verrucomicrobiota bacterium]MBU4289833.1 paraquat-inducible protein A [Verrucomicrobiota bacterium]MBU4497911.1 paraquat-inducible protein A [Verrucomicrobiota bacterium]MCG2681228.1 paraquat-inducible protein A [Kiritimatiellia bacterium]